MSEPRTEAGRSLLEHMTEDAAGFLVITSNRFSIKWVLDALAKDIPAIEAEAVTLALAEVRQFGQDYLAIQRREGAPQSEIAVTLDFLGVLVDATAKEPSRE